MSYYPLQHPLPLALMDALLAQGYYRMQQSIFTTRAIGIEEGKLHQVLWARILLKGFTPSKNHKELTKRCSRFCTTLLNNTTITKETEEMYAAYARSVNFDAPESATSFLMGQSRENYFPGKTWQVRDDGKLVATGYFDLALESAAGILNFYHPDYKKYSLGKWLYLESVNYAAEAGKTYFYPGYIVLDYPKFDYKLLPGKELIEVWEPDGQVWIPYQDSIHAKQARVGVTVR